MPELKSTLARIFGFKDFRPHQEEIVRCLLDKRDIFAVMPTGGGKSLCFQLPAHLQNGVCVVISPLISLMKDQVDAACSIGLRAATLNSMNTNIQNQNIGQALKDGEIDLLYLSPERFNSDYFISRLKTLQISFFAIDEAHCISEWGHDFRKDYLALARISQEFPNTPIAAFTATATNRVSDDIAKRLNLRSPFLVRASFNRPNLYYQIERKSKVNDQILTFLRARPKESGIIYRQSRKKTEALAEFLRENGINAKAYHAGMEDADRNRVQEAFRRDECPIIVATIAFGMGIDKSNVRFVVHGEMPKNMESYYQETGRAGRDGAPAHCLLFYGPGDVIMYKHFHKEIEDEAARAIAEAQLKDMESFSNSIVCRRKGILAYFNEVFPEANCGNCDVCKNKIVFDDATIPAQKALSAVVRTEQRFGATHIADVLVGSRTEMILKYKHDEIKTFGIGNDQPKTYWKYVLEQLLNNGYLEKTDETYNTLGITEKGRAVLKGQATFSMPKYATTQTERKEKKERLTFNTAESGSEFAKEMFEKLRKLRIKIAAEKNIPPYLVFSDRTLNEMIQAQPQSIEELISINGVGERKAEMYGAAFINVLREFAVLAPLLSR